MSEQERVPFWQVWRLRLRTLVGWGENIPTLRYIGRHQARATLWVLVMPLLLAVLAYAPPPLGMIRRPLPLAAAFGVWLPVMISCLGLMAISAAWSVAYLRRANAGEHQSPTTFDGACFATVLDTPRRLFALIGPSRELAQWFCLPIEWDPMVEPGDDHYTLSYIPATGFVERLLRTGAISRELTQRTDVIMRRNRDGARIIPEQEGAASREQRAALLREARRHGWAWGLSDRALSTLGWLFIAAGCAYAFLVAILAPLLASPKRLTPENAQVLPFLVPIFGILSIATFVAGGALLRIWAQRRRGAAAIPIEIEGEQVCWTPTGLQSSTLGATLAQVRLDGGEMLIFRIPERLAHRVRKPNARVRVTYNEPVGPVLDYRAVEAPTNKTSTRQDGLFPQTERQGGDAW